MPQSRSAGGSAETSRPSWRIVPLVCGSRPAMARSRVVLPQPEGPRKQTNSPRSIDSDTASSAVNMPNLLVTRSTSRYGMS